MRQYFALQLPDTTGDPLLNLDFSCCCCWWRWGLFVEGEVGGCKRQAEGWVDVHRLPSKSQYSYSLVVLFERSSWVVVCVVEQFKSLHWHPSGPKSTFCTAGIAIEAGVVPTLVGGAADAAEARANSRMHAVCLMAGWRCFECC